MFSQIQFQDALTNKLMVLAAKGYKGRKCWNMTVGKAVRQLRTIGYSLEIAEAIAFDAKDMAKLAVECQS